LGFAQWLSKIGAGGGERAGGDFADGAIAHQGAGLGGDIFASFERGALAKFIALVVAAAEPATLNAEPSKSQ
jgi:hypothetical protein